MPKKEFLIDFVVSWVDGSDQNWLKKMQSYSDENIDDKKRIRFRDYGTLKYLFRSIEKNAPWVNKVYLVTDNQIPEWFNETQNKLVLINHEDIIDDKYLPTFNSNVIDFNLHKIKGLSEYFVYFNDDMFLNKKVKKEDFFDHNGNSRDTLGLNAIMPIEDFDHIHVNNLSIVNKEFHKRNTLIKKNFLKLFNLKNYEWNLFSLLLLPWPRFTRFYDPHTPVSYRKSTIKYVLKKYPNVLEDTGQNKFRSANDYSLWIARYFQMLTGDFSVRSAHFGKRYNLDQYVKIGHDIDNSTHKVICINDTVDLSDDELIKAERQINSKFEAKYPNKSSFEK
ncbi:stealth family protein [Paucilactobacillus sp. N302-9]